MTDKHSNGDGDARSVVPVERPVRRRRRGILLRLVLFALGLVVLVALIIAYAWWSLFIKADHVIEADRPVQIEITSGVDTAEIAGLLSSAGIIPNANMFRLKAARSGMDVQLKAGVYDLCTGMSYGDVLDQLVAGPPIDYVTVTIPEGYTVEQMAVRFEEQTWLSAVVFMEIAMGGADSFDYGFLASNQTGSLEGYLFPKTYRIPEESTIEEVIRMMLDQFERETAGIDLTYAVSFGLDAHDWVTLASMIEREVRVVEERRLVSSVIYNRLERGMHLEIDATIEYILPGTRSRLLNEHLEIDSPYNTYMYSGLPPGPIAAPGLAALEAAADPDQTEYLYYVLTSENGSHTFTETYEEFLKAKEESRDVVP